MTEKTVLKDVFDELQHVKGNTYNYYEDVDAWVISPYDKLNNWVMAQFRELKKNKSYIPKRFTDKKNNIKTYNIRKEVTEDTILIYTVLEGKNGRHCNISFRFMLDEGYPLY